MATAPGTRRSDDHNRYAAARPDKAPPPICPDRIAPVTTLSKPSITAKGLTVKGRMSDTAGACSGGVVRVDVAVARKVGKKCSWIGTSKPESYVVAAIALDTAGNLEAVVAKRRKAATLKSPRRS